MDMITRRKFLAALAALPIVGRFVTKTEAFSGSIGTPVALSPTGFAPGGILLTWFDPWHDIHSKAFRPIHAAGEWFFPSVACVDREYEILPGAGMPRPDLCAVWNFVPASKPLWMLSGYVRVRWSDDRLHAYFNNGEVKIHWRDCVSTLGPTRLGGGDSISVSDIDRLTVRFGGVPDSRAGILGRLKR
jgi:hypothetical protein